MLCEGTYTEQSSNELVKSLAVLKSDHPGLGATEESRVAAQTQQAARPVLTSSIPGLRTPALGTAGLRLFSAQQHTCHSQNHLINKRTREAGAVPHALSLFSGLKSMQPEAFRPDPWPWPPRPWVQASATLGAGGSGGPRRGRGRPPAPAAVDVAPSPLVHGSFSGRRVGSGSPDETNLQEEKGEHGGFLQHFALLRRRL